MPGDSPAIARIWSAAITLRLSLHTTTPTNPCYYPISIWVHDMDPWTSDKECVHLMHSSAAQSREKECEICLMAQLRPGFQCSHAKHEGL